LRIHPDRDINTFYDWLKILSEDDAVITNEYGHAVSFDQLVRTIADRGDGLQTSSYALPAEDPTCTWVYCDYEFC